MADQTGLVATTTAQDLVDQLTLAASTQYLVENLSETSEVRIAKLAAAPSSGFPTYYNRILPGTRLGIDTGSASEVFLVWTLRGSAPLSVVEA